MLEATPPVPAAACWTLREISLVAALCLFLRFLQGPGLEVLALEDAVAKYRDGARHVADLVGAVGAWDVDRGVAGGERAHRPDHARQGGGDASGDGDGRADHQNQKNRADERQGIAQGDHGRLLLVHRDGADDGPGGAVEDEGCGGHLHQAVAVAVSLGGGALTLERLVDGRAFDSSLEQAAGVGFSPSPSNT